MSVAQEGLDTHNEQLNAMLAELSRQPYTWQEPESFDLSSEDDTERLTAKLAAGEVTGVHDKLEAIAHSLFELEHPADKGDDAKRGEYVADILSQGIAHGKWFLFPWSGELVRYPDEAAHRALRTSRNRNLITDEEQQRLYEAKIAVFGLSVGSSVVERLLASGVGGTLIMGDPDRIDPSNLNRINGGFPTVDLNKTDLMGRKISEADPYINQVHFTEGATTETLAQLRELSPSIIFDEVDHLPTKLALRQLAQELRVPLIMATDLGDKAIIDIERYDLDEAQPFDGRLHEGELERLRTGEVTAQELGQYVLKVVGAELVSTRLMGSLAELNRTLPGLPQLGSTATMGGALSTIVARDIILGRGLPTGRYVCSPKQLFEQGLDQEYMTDI